MAPALAPGAIGQEIAACALLGMVLGLLRAFFPTKGRAAFGPDFLFVGAALLGLQSYAACRSIGGVLRWYMVCSTFFCAFAVEKLLRRPLRGAENALLWLLQRPLRFVRWLASPAIRACKERHARAKVRRQEKRTAKKPKKNLPSTQRMLYNSNVSK